MSWFCPYAKCAETGSKEEEKVCKRRTGQNCYIFALKRIVRWKNDIVENTNYKNRKFSSTMSLSAVEEKLTQLGFVGYESIDKKEEKPQKTVMKGTIEDKDIVKKIKELSDLFKAGVLTQEEFTKAKKKLLN